MLKVANDVLYNSYFGQKNPAYIMTKYYDASDLHSIAEDYIDKACKELENILNDWKEGDNMNKRQKNSPSADQANKEKTLTTYSIRGKKYNVNQN